MWYDVVTVVLLKIWDYWDITPCYLINSCQCYKQTTMLQTIYQSIQHNSLQQPNLLWYLYISHWWQITIRIKLCSTLIRHVTFFVTGTGIMYPHWITGTDLHQHSKTTTDKGKTRWTQYPSNHLNKMHQYWSILLQNMH